MGLYHVNSAERGMGAGNLPDETLLDVLSVPEGQIGQMILLFEQHRIRCAS
jgi:hypothetical protein